ncbi:ATP-dependent DNA helicase RecG [candidate division WWE3 bacterium]|uniref:Probable DNA 3'-5' helicase RecG n=1 Tax=candidate division WWE3 bacterium TaxID=2053526 RepID=A0A955LGI4_UNCKA|nr:ATP-dependent DNA helicase RecG [candidate division WWE3 bacterium]
MDISASITSVTGVGEKSAEKLERLGILTIEDLFYHIPSRYLDFRNAVPIKQATVDETVSITGEIWEISNAFTRRGKKITTAVISDESGTMELIWFNQTYLTKAIQPGDVIHAAGNVGWWAKKKAIIAPMWQKESPEGDGLNTILPIYPETEGVTSAWLRKITKNAWDSSSNQINETMPERIIDKYDLLSLPRTLETLHFPKDFSNVKKAHYRLSFEEMFHLQQEALRRRAEWDQQESVFFLQKDQFNKEVDQLIESLPFTLTSAQTHVVEDVYADFLRKSPMNRLVQGDVGSGKTVVAAIAAYITYLAGYPTFLMAPTEVLAQQHYQTISSILKEKVSHIALVSGSKKTDSFELGDIIIGTHALFHQREKLPEAGLVIIDEQHKFGVEQRAQLVFREGHRTPHIMTMTATPIPRSLALTVYGDQDLSLIDELPPGRKPVKTWVVEDHKHEKAYQWIHDQVLSTQKNKPQTLIVYPLIDDSEHESMADVKAATTEFEYLQHVFSDLRVELLHGRLKPTEKNTIVEQFRSGEIDILISTSVVEVGIDAPNATIIIVENAERFGLATLHQLRGRVGRRGQQGYCFLFSGTDDELTLQRLKAMETHHNGLKLAEIDLELRGPGQVFGTQQHGVGELRFAKITDLDLIQKTRDAAKITSDPN